MTPIRKSALLPLVLALASTLMFSCSSRARTVTIGALYPQTGPQGPEGTEELRGVRLAAEWANSHGGDKGRPVKLVVADAPRAESVPSAMLGLKGRGARIVVGSHGSAVSAVAAETAAKNGMLLWETGAVGEVDTSVDAGRSFFRVAPMGTTLGRSGIAFIADRVAPSLNAGRPLRYAIAYVDDPYGRGVSAGARDEIKARGLPLVGEYPYNAQTADFHALAAQIKASGADVLYVSAYIDDGVALRRATVEDHVPLLASIGTSSSYCHPQFGNELGTDAVGLFASDKPDAADVRADALSAEGRTALEWVQSTYQQRFKEPMSAPALSGFSNAYALFVHVLPGAASASPAAVARAALSVKLPEGTLANGGGLDFAPPGTPDAGGNRASAGVIWEWVASKTRAVVWPPAYATHAVTPMHLAGSPA